MTAHVEVTLKRLTTYKYFALLIQIGQQVVRS